MELVIGRTAVIAVWDIDVIMDVPLWGVEYIVHQEALIGFRPLGDR